MKKNLAPKIQNTQCFDPEAHKKFIQDLTKKCMEMMARGICPFCLCKIEKHSGIKSQVCEKTLKQKLHVRSYLMVNDKLVEVIFRPATKEELE